MTDKRPEANDFSMVLEWGSRGTDQTATMTPSELAARLWPDSDRLSIEGLEAATQSVPNEIRGEFLSNLIALVHGLVGKCVGKDEIAARVIAEIAAARGEEDRSDELSLELDIDNVL